MFPCFLKGSERLIYDEKRWPIKGFQTLPSQHPGSTHPMIAQKRDQGGSKSRKGSDRVRFACPDGSIINRIPTFVGFHAKKASFYVRNLPILAKSYIVQVKVQFF